MKFICDKCIKEAQGAGETPISTHPCVLEVKDIGMIKLERPNIIEALRRCPFENDINDKFTGVVPEANWRKI